MKKKHDHFYKTKSEMKLGHCLKGVYRLFRQSYRVGIFFISAEKLENQEYLLELWCKIVPLAKFSASVIGFWRFNLESPRWSGTFNLNERHLRPFVGLASWRFIFRQMNEWKWFSIPTSSAEKTLASKKTLASRFPSFNQANWFLFIRFERGELKEKL